MPPLFTGEVSPQVTEGLLSCVSSADPSGAMRHLPCAQGRQGNTRGMRHPVFKNSWE